MNYLFHTILMLVSLLFDIFPFENFLIIPAMNLREKNTLCKYVVADLVYSNVYIQMALVYSANT